MYAFSQVRKSLIESRKFAYVYTDGFALTWEREVVWVVA
jgi:hypothetical protein